MRESTPCLFLSQYVTQILIALGFLVCSLGLQNGVEKITTVMMSCLFIVIVILIVRSVTLKGAGAGLRFYLILDFAAVQKQGVMTVVSAAMGQAFFTLSLGIGAIAIFGSYIDKSQRLTGEAINVAVLDTLVALMAGLIIFPACFAFGVNPGSGPNLVFITLPNVFNEMAENLYHVYSATYRAIHLLSGICGEISVDNRQDKYLCTNNAVSIILIRGWHS